jgi:hypothetical protein
MLYAIGAYNRHESLCAGIHCSGLLCFAVTVTYAVAVDGVGTAPQILREELVGADARLPSENEYISSSNGTDESMQH